MSVGPLSGLGGFAGAPFAQKAASQEAASQREAARSRVAQTNQQAEQAEGIGATQEDEATSDRDADGRRLWERQPPQAEEDTTEEDRPGRDASGDRGNLLDLNG